MSDKSLPAFPSGGEGMYAPQSGMTMREYIATAALQGLCAAVDDYSPNRLMDHDGMAKEAVGLADALLQELAK